jgi:hypothetical protein
MGLFTLITVDTGISTQATVTITVTRRCGRRGITLVQSTTLANYDHGHGHEHARVGPPLFIEHVLTSLFW